MNCASGARVQTWGLWFLASVNSVIPRPQVFGSVVGMCSGVGSPDGWVAVGAVGWADEGICAQGHRCAQIRWYTDRIRGRQGLALIFIPTGGGGTPPPWTPSPPPPSAQVQLKTWVLGTFFGDGEKISRRLLRTPHTVYLWFYVYSAFLVLQITMTQRSLSVYFCSPVQPSPRAKRKDVIDALLYFRFKDRITGRKRQEAYNEAQKACATLFLSVPMATLV